MAPLHPLPRCKPQQEIVMVGLKPFSSVSVSLKNFFYESCSTNLGNFRKICCNKAKFQFLYFCITKLNFFLLTGMATVILNRIAFKIYTCSTIQLYNHHHLNNQLHCVHTLCIAETNFLISYL